MISIEISYHPIPFLPWKRKLSCNFPENWKELNSAQLSAIAGASRSTSDDAGFLHQMTGISRRILKKLAKFQLWSIGELLDWTKSVQPLNSFIIPEIKAGSLILKSPLPRLKKVTFSQFIFADSCFSDYQDSESETDLNRFVACWYLPSGKELTEEMMESNAKLLNKASLPDREAVALNYLLVRQWLCDVYPLVFIPSSGEKAEPGKKKQSSSTGWIRIFEQVMGDDIIHSDEYAALPLHNVLRHLTRKIKDNMKKS